MAGLPDVSRPSRFERSDAGAVCPAPAPSPRRRALCGGAALAGLTGLTGLLGLGGLSGCASSQPPEGIRAVSPFDLARYQGRWYEIARLDHRFERGLSDVSATYTPQPDGSVRVVNRGFDAGKGGQGGQGVWSEAVGKALFTGAPTTASLKVSFFGPFYGGYHVAALDADYRWALVVGPDRGYFWILARDKTLAAPLRAELTGRAQALGIHTPDLIWVEQRREDPALAPSPAR